MADITRPWAFNKVVVGEVRATLIGPAPNVGVRFAFMDDDGQTYGHSTLRAWSPQSYQLLQELCASLEQDILDRVCVGEDPDGSSMDLG